MVLGGLLLGFCAFQLVGSNWVQGQSQQHLRSEVEHLLPTYQLEVSPPEAAPSVPAPPDAAILGRITLPTLGVDQVLIQGTSTSDLELGPGHYPGTPLPGAAGDAAIAGHRTTWGRPFANLDQLRGGDPIIVTTAQGRFTFRVSSSSIVAPTDLGAITPSKTPTLTLTTCNPRYSAAQRLVIHAFLSSVGWPVRHLVHHGRTVVVSVPVPATLAPVPGVAMGWLSATWATIAASIAILTAALTTRRRWWWLVVPVLMLALLMTSAWLTPILPTGL